MIGFKKILLSLFALNLAFLPFLASAQYGGFQGTGAGLNIERVGLSLANAIWIIFTVIAVLCFVFAGIMFLTAFGDADKIKTARSAFLWGIVGVVVAIFAYTAVALIRRTLGG